jgi:hypothetical protein
MRIIHTAVLAMLLVTATACAQAPQDFAPPQLGGFPRGTLEIERTGGRDNFRIWIADTAARQEQGLMYIRELPPDYGMVFPLAPPRVMYRWRRRA